MTRKRQTAAHGAGSLERFSESITRWTGGTLAFMFALGVIVGWLLLGPVFHFSDTWQLVINTATTIVTFLMVFLIQRSQNKDARAAAIKLNELIAAVEGASNRLIAAESLSEHELGVIDRHFHELAHLACREGSIGQSHSIEEASSRHARKHKARRAG